MRLIIYVHKKKSTYSVCNMYIRVCIIKTHENVNGSVCTRIYLIPAAAEWNEIKYKLMNLIRTHARTRTHIRARTEAVGNLYIIYYTSWGGKKKRNEYKTNGIFLLDRVRLSCY